MSEPGMNFVEVMMNRGVLYGIGGYILWGILPIYWKMLGQVSSWEILAHRIVWSFVFLGGILVITRQWHTLRPVISQPRTMALFVLSAVLLSINWGVYIWGVTAGYIIETSLGYFINPLVNVLLGVFFLKEQLRGGQWLAIAFAALGVIYLTFNYGSLPWISLTLAFSFGFYGYLRKTSSLNSLQGLSLEIIVLLAPALIFLTYLGANQQGHFVSGGPWLTILLVGCGVVTAVPLLLFAAGARRIQLSMMGLLQYLAPTLQFLIGLLIYGEDFPLSRLVGFSFIWIALIILTIDSFWRRPHAVATT